MTTIIHRSRFSRILASFLAFLLGFGPLATPGYAALTKLADEPLSVSNQSKSNIVMTVDDSTSMLFDFLPDYVVEAYCRDKYGDITTTKDRFNQSYANGSLCGFGGTNIDLTASGSGKYKTPGYIFEQYNYPFQKYNAGFDAGGPGAGCDMSIPPFGLCNFGIDSGASPGLPVYPTGTQKAGQRYEYNQLWPAPVHNSAFNHLYYNPALTYDPPVYDDGSPYPSMTAGNTTNWTKVPADPWASTIVNVDLTAPVTVGQWCNSDFTMGLANDTTHCRTNGTVAAGYNGDYTYPWVPSGMNLDYNLGYQADNVNPVTNKYTIGMSLAYSKVDSGTKAVLAAWSGGGPKDAQYFYQNDNVIWCDATNALWPQGGTPITQTCNGASNTPQTCSGGPVPSCTGTNQTCAGITPQTCTGSTAQTCGAFTAQTCLGNVTQTCNGITAQTCNGFQTQTCGGLTAQTCNGFQTQTCNNVNAQTCNGYATQTCNGLTAQTCNGYSTQTCDNIVNTGDVCVNVWDPPGCDACGFKPECPSCVLKPSCTPTLVGKCTVTKAACTTANAAAVCTPVNGKCSIDTGVSCQPANVASQCPSVGKCSVNTGTSCKAATAATDCPTINGKCSLTNVACQPANAATQCPGQGKCSVNTGVACTAATAATDCPSINGKCSVTNVACQPANAATQCPTTGKCTVSNAACTAANEATVCTPINGKCSITMATCTTANQATTCPGTGKCSTSMAACTAANAGTVCTMINGKCSITMATCTTANQATTCPDQGKCSTSMAACTAANAATNCPNLGGKCSIDTATSCTPANAGTACTQYGKCSSTMIQCTAANAATKCPVIAPKCTTGDFRACCTVATDCQRTCNLTGATCTAANAATDCPNQVVAGKCSVSMAACSTTCPNIPSASLSATCSDKLSDNSKSLLEDANSTGVVCRRNNKDYGGAPTANQFNYPSGKFTTPVTAGVGANACTATPRFATVPRHYWKTSLEWCTDKVSATNDKWNGYGDISKGTCQSYRDATHVVPRFYKFGAAAGSDNVTTAGMERVDLDFATKPSYKHVFTDGATLVTINRTFAEEVENYANWFAYYRTRIQAVKTVTSLAFLGKTLGKFNVDDKYRVGLHTLSNNPGTSVAKFVDVQDFTVAQKTKWAKELFAITIPLGNETPNLDAMIRIGEWFANGSSASLSGSSDPIVLSCQKNWHMLFTDGITNQSLPAVTVNNVDLKVPDFKTDPRLADLSTAGLVIGSNWPAPYIEDTTKAVSNSASDYSTFYWASDFRQSGAMAKNNVPVSGADPANWQHLNFAAMSLGTEGKLAAGNQAGVEAQIKGGAVQWPEPYPTTNKPDASGVDDLWHASLNARGQFVNADNTDELKAGMGAILANIANQAGTRAGAVFQSPNLSATNAFFYRTRFEPGWGGSVEKVAIDPFTGTEGVVQWEASSLLTSVLVPTLAIPTPWFDSRKVVTMDDKGVAMPFLWPKLTAAQQDALAPSNAARGQLTLEYLRGSPLNEGTKSFNFRKRDTALGDVVNSQAVYVGPPGAAYDKATNANYDKFISDWKSRPSRVYVGGNDGMMHAFDDANGAETFAYIPFALHRDPASAGLGALTFQTARLPRFEHHYYVDSTPRLVDAFVEDGAPHWATVLVGGLGKGGNAYYAIDVTDPASIKTEDDAASKVMWEFTDKDLGYTYGRAIVAKTPGFGGKWVVIVPSGYNNADTGQGKIFFIDLATGKKLKELTTGYGSTTTPAGLAQIAAFTKNAGDLQVEQIYGGDLYGNFWRFDLTTGDETTWKDAELMAVLTDPSTGARQPVTTPPQIEIDISNAIDRWVFVGTGRLLHQDDLADSQLQTLWAFRDGSNAKRGDIGVPVTRATVGMFEVKDKDGLASRPDKGWYDDLPAGQRIVTPIQAAIAIIAYAGTKPQTDPCLTGQPAEIYARDYSHGKSVIEDDVTGTVVESVSSAGGAQGVDFGVLYDNGAAAAAGQTPPLRLFVTQGSDSKVHAYKLNLPEYVQIHRMSWRLLGQ